MYLFDDTTTYCPEGGTCTGYAQGGTRVVETNGYGILYYASIPMVEQVALHLSRSEGSFNSTELVLVWTGMNDIFFQLDSYASGQDKMSSIIGVIDAAVALCRTVVIMLQKGVRYVVVIGSSLQSSSTSPESLTSTFLTEIFNGVIRNVLSSENVLFIDPTLYSPIGHFADLTTPACDVSKINRYFGTALTYGWSVGCNVDAPYADLVSGANVTTWLMADDVHPTTGGHAFIAEIVWTEMRKRGWVV